MRAAKPREPSEQEFSTAWRLFQALHDHPSAAAAESLIAWLGGRPARVRALDEVLTVWACAGAAVVNSRQDATDRPELMQ